MHNSIVKKIPFPFKTYLKGRENLQNIISNSAWLYAGRFIRMLVGLTVGVWVARYLGPEQFGLLSYTIAFVSFFQAIAMLGLNEVTVKYFVETPDDIEKIIGTVFYLKLAGSLIAIVLAYTVMLIWHPADTRLHTLVFIVASGMAFQFVDVFKSINQARMKSNYTVIASISGFLIANVLKVAFIVTGAPLEYFAFAGTIEVSIITLTMYIIFRNTLNNDYSFVFCFKQAKEMLNLSWPLIVSGIAVLVYMRIDQLMLGEMLSQKAVGIYTAALRFSEIWYVIPTILVSSSLPVILEAKKASVERQIELLQRLFSILVKIALTASVVITFFSNDLIQLFYGKQYIEAASVLTVHIWASTFVFLGAASSSWIISNGYTKYSMMQTTAGAIVNILLNLLFIPKFGPLGAAYATVISYAVSGYLFNAVWPPARKIFILQSRAFVKL